MKGLEEDIGRRQKQEHPINYSLQISWSRSYDPNQLIQIMWFKSADPNNLIQIIWYRSFNPDHLIKISWSRSADPNHLIKISWSLSVVPNFHSSIFFIGQSLKSIYCRFSCRILITLYIVQKKKKKKIYIFWSKQFNFSSCNNISP